MKKLLSIVLLLHFVFIVFGQNYEFKDYKFSDEKSPKIASELASENEIYLQRDIKIEILVDGNDVKQYYLLHEKILLNSDDAIERNNKVYIPFGINEKLLVNKVRVVLSDGKINELSNDDIKEETNEETGTKYKYFAVNGLEKGALIEKIFILEERPELNGKVIKMQLDQPVVNTSFELIYPIHLEMKYKSYNNLPDAELNQEAYGTEKASLFLTATNIEPFPTNESYANENANTKIFRYKLYANAASGAYNLNNYKEYASSVYENLHVETDNKMNESIQEFLKDVPKASSVEDQISFVENKIKTNITHNKYFNENKIFTDVFKSKQANDVDMMQLYLAVFKELEIEAQIVLTSKRYTTLFDLEFESLDQISDLLLYFPSCEQYVEPTTAEYRMPLFNFNYGENYGLFIQEKEFGGVKMGMGEVRKIEIPDGSVTHDFTDISVDFTKDIENPTIHTVHKHQGYSAMSYQLIKDYVPADRYQDILYDIAENFTQKKENISVKSENDGISFLGKKPFILDMTFDGSDLIQKAGNNILFNVGVLIGKQMEMYQADKRVLPVEMPFPHFYTRTIEFLLPDGYTILNPEVFDMEYTTQSDDKKYAVWKSSITIKGNKATVSNSEKYFYVQIPLKVFDDYKKVINAAADFNKIVIVLSKTK